MEQGLASFVFFGCESMYCGYVIQRRPLIPEVVRTLLLYWYQIIPCPTYESVLTFNHTPKPVAENKKYL